MPATKTKPAKGETDNAGGQEKLKAEAAEAAKLSAPSQDAPGNLTPKDVVKLAVADLTQMVKARAVDNERAAKRVNDAGAALVKANAEQIAQAIRDVRTSALRYATAEATGAKTLGGRMRACGLSIHAAFANKALVNKSKDKSKTSLRGVAADMLRSDATVREHYAGSKNPVGALTTKLSRARSFVDAVGPDKVHETIWESYPVRLLGRFGSFARRDKKMLESNPDWQGIGSWAGEKLRTVDEIKERYPSTTVVGADKLAKAVEAACAKAGAWMGEHTTHPDVGEIVARSLVAFRAMLHEVCDEADVTVVAKQ
jgi:hypothetical protein